MATDSTEKSILGKEGMAIVIFILLLPSFLLHFFVLYPYGYSVLRKT